MKISKKIRIMSKEELNMTSREFLKKYQWVAIEARELENIIVEIYENEIRLPGLSFSERVSSSQSGDKSMINTIVAISKKKELFENKLFDCRETMNDIKNSIEAVQDDRMKIILEKRYIGGKTLEEIAEDMNYSSRHIRRLHHNALNIIKVPEKYKNK